MAALVVPLVYSALSGLIGVMLNDPTTVLPEEEDLRGDRPVVRDVVNRKGNLVGTK